MVRVLGISASLRNARYGLGNEVMIADLRALPDRAALTDYLRRQTRIRFEDFAAAGRAEDKPFDEIYSQLRRLRGERGLSNSEAAVAAALWGALQEGADVAHLSLAAHFPMSGPWKDIDHLRNELVRADAIIISGPVYFGDRGSLTQSLIEFIAADPALRDACKGKVYVGIAVGAKRNGGQETTLIYQMLDLVNLDFLAVGNSSETTSQYGGTAVAGDVGSMHDDDYGIETCIGSGQRAARVAALMRAGKQAEPRLRDPLKLQLWLLQDNLDGDGRKMFQDWADEVSASANVDIQILDATREEIVRCIACDICPTDVGRKEDYRCIIKSGGDFFVRHHQTLVDADAVLLCAYSPQDRSKVISAYQKFIERTRYLRRDNYALTDMLMAPFVISEMSARQNLHLRMLTSAVRHHTVLHHPIIGMVHEGELLSKAAIVELGRSFVASARALTAGRLVQGASEDLVYQPLGYEISGAKAGEDQASGRTLEFIRENAAQSSQEAERRFTIRRA